MSLIKTLIGFIDHFIIFSLLIVKLNLVKSILTFFRKFPPLLDSLLRSEFFIYNIDLFIRTTFNEKRVLGIELKQSSTLK